MALMCNFLFNLKEFLPANADIEWMQKVFGEADRVLHVSLPKFQSTHDIKRFGFVEFETVKGAQEACKVINIRVW